MKKPSSPPSRSSGNRKKQRLQRELVRISEYLVSGGLYFWTGYAVFFVLDKKLGFGLFWANLLCNLAGWTVNFLLQRFWVFNDPRLAKHKVDMTGRYIFITLVNFGLDYLIIAGLKQLGVSPYVGKFLSAGFFTVWNYIWYKTWVFAAHIHHRPRSSSKRSKRR
jgi:putative flippase GtrA